MIANFQAKQTQYQISDALYPILEKTDVFFDGNIEAAESTQTITLKLIIENGRISQGEYLWNGQAFLPLLAYLEDIEWPDSQESYMMKLFLIYTKPNERRSHK